MNLPSPSQRGQLAPPTGSTTTIASSSPDLPPVRNVSWRRARDAIMMPWSTDRRDAGTATRTPPAQESSVDASLLAVAPTRRLARPDHAWHA
ncbi:hypothetical protein AMAG_19484 [Allomyces macrogynus ATCC 38327]|uniref:Uncharacterized protein n=1 Tax=Allomyces macrogynus (strain ATCC 38327) TaxID=578462 RepID=A0A0L0ST28_ALLM3|nr:hypothetical protein AMAG_19484 [Allomyces macrogynus ATCC 38327]|eukprot:KNE65535.1 hypothetical protein AMAG_19484 [Allomyces macrogynus ATCC 38327]